MTMRDDDATAPKTLAETTLCTVARSEGGLVDIQIGNVILRLPERDVASLTGTLKRVTRQLFPRHAARPVDARAAGRARFEVIEGGRRASPRFDPPHRR